MKKGFTLIEVLAVIVVLGILAVVVAPIINNNMSDNIETAKQIQEKNIIKAAKDWFLENIDDLPENGETTRVKLSNLKQGYLPINMKNPETGAILSNESYVEIKNTDGDYEYLVELCDIPNEVEETDLIVFGDNFLNEEIEVASVVNHYDINVYDKNGNQLDYSKQYILNNNEVARIDTSSENIYSIVYTVVYNEKIYKRVKTVTIK